MPSYKVGRLKYTVANPENHMAKSDGESWIITFDSDLYGARTYSFRLNIHFVSGSATLEIDDNEGKIVSYAGEITTDNEILSIPLNHQNLKY